MIIESKAMRSFIGDSALNEDTQIKILSYLDPEALGRCRRVSILWGQLASSNSLWEKVIPGLTIPQGVGAKEYIYSLNLMLSYGQIAQKIETLFSTVQFNQKVSFDCSFPFNPNCTVRAALTYGDVPAQAEPNIKEDWIFIRKLPTTVMGLMHTHSGSHGAYRPGEDTIVLASGDIRPGTVFAKWEVKLPNSEGRDEMTLLFQIWLSAANQVDALLNQPPPQLL